jgi:hypothetical protein
MRRETRAGLGDVAVAAALGWSFFLSYPNCPIQIALSHHSPMIPHDPGPGSGLVRFVQRMEDGDYGGLEPY